MPSVRASSPSSSSSASSHSILYLNQLLPHHQRGLQSHSHSHSTSGGPSGRRSTSSSSSTSRANSATTATPATATANATVRRTGTTNSGSVSIASSDDFEHLLSRQDTLKMSLTPNRVRHAGMVAPSTGRPSADGNGSGNRYGDWEEEEEAEVSEREEPARVQSASMPPSTSSRPYRQTATQRRFQPRSARQTRPSDIDEESGSQAGGGAEALDSEDECLLGLPRGGNRNGSRNGNAKQGRGKDSLMDFLSSDPPWATSDSGPSSSPAAAPGCGTGQSKAERMMGLSNRSASSASRVNRAMSAGAATKTFTPIANLAILETVPNVPPKLQPPAGQNPRPHTGSSEARSFLTSSTNPFDNLSQHDLHSFPLPPAGSSTSPIANRLQSHKSSPNLSSGLPSFPSTLSLVANGSTASLSAGTGPPRRKLVAKDERAPRAERHDDLLDFLNSAPPPSFSSPTSLWPNEPTTPTASVSSKSGSRSSKLKSFLGGGGSSSFSRHKAGSVIASSVAEVSGFTVDSDTVPILASISSSFQRMGSGPRSRQSSREQQQQQQPYQLPHVTFATPAPQEGGIGDFGQLRRKLSKTGGRTGFSSAPTQPISSSHAAHTGVGSAAPPLSSVLQHSARDVQPQQHHRGAFGEPAAAYNGAPSPGQQHQQQLTPDNSKEDLYALLSRSNSYIAQSHPLPSASPVRKASMAPVPLDTPPTSPYDKLPMQSSIPGLVHDASSPSAAKQHRRTSSLIKRKPSPRIEDEDLDALNLAAPIEAAERKGSTASAGSLEVAEEQRYMHAGRPLSDASQTPTVSGSSYKGTLRASIDRHRSREASNGSLMSIASARTSPTIAEEEAITEAIPSGTVAGASNSSPVTADYPIQEACVSAELERECEERETIPTPLYQQGLLQRANSKHRQMAQAQALASSKPAPISPARPVLPRVRSSGISSSGALSPSSSRPGSVVMLPLSPSAPLPGSHRERERKPDVHDILLALRNDMLTASTVTDCLELVDSVMFDLAYEVKSGRSTIYEELEEEAEGYAYAVEADAPSHSRTRIVRQRTSTHQNRAYNALIEHLMGSMVGQQQRQPYARNFTAHGIHSSGSQESSVPATPRKTRALSPVRGSPRSLSIATAHDMQKTPSLGYSSHQSGSGDSDAGDSSPADAYAQAPSPFYTPLAASFVPDDYATDALQDFAQPGPTGSDARRKGSADAGLAGLGIRSAEIKRMSDDLEVLHA